MFEKGVKVSNGYDIGGGLNVKEVQAAYFRPSGKLYTHEVVEIDSKGNLKKYFWS